jgi:hypothetical protein
MSWLPKWTADQWAVFIAAWAFLFGRLLPWFGITDHKTLLTKLATLRAGLRERLPIRVPKLSLGDWFTAVGFVLILYVLFRISAPQDPDLYFPADNIALARQNNDPNLPFTLILNTILDNNSPDNTYTKWYGAMGAVPGDMTSANKKILDMEYAVKNAAVAYSLGNGNAPVGISLSGGLAESLIGPHTSQWFTVWGPPLTMTEYSDWQNKKTTAVFFAVVIAQRNNRTKRFEHCAYGDNTPGVIGGCNAEVFDRP